MKNTGNKRLRRRDTAEQWLKENDPEYSASKKDWEVPRTDALARDDTFSLDELSEKQRHTILSQDIDDES